MTNDELDNPPRRPWEGSDPSTERDLATARARIAALEAEVTKWSCAWCEANARVADLEAEKQEFANFQLHEVVELREKVATLEAERDKPVFLNALKRISKLERERDRLRKGLEIFITPLNARLAPASAELARDILAAAPQEVTK